MCRNVSSLYRLFLLLQYVKQSFEFCDCVSLPVDSNDDSSPDKARVILSKFLCDVLKHFQSPDPIVNGSVELIRLQDRKVQK